MTPPGNILLNKINVKDNLTNDPTNTDHVVVRSKEIDTQTPSMNLHNMNITWPVLGPECLAPGSELCSPGDSLHLFMPWYPHV